VGPAASTCSSTSQRWEIDVSSLSSPSFAQLKCHAEQPSPARFGHEPCPEWDICACQEGRTLFAQLLPLLRAEVFGDDPRLPTDPARESIDIAATRSLAGKGAFKVIG
jgi:hypothetical protein